MTLDRKKIIESAQKQKRNFRRIGLSLETDLIERFDRFLNKNRLKRTPVIEALLKELLDEEDHPNEKLS